MRNGADAKRCEKPASTRWLRKLGATQRGAIIEALPPARPLQSSARDCRYPAETVLIDEGERCPASGVTPALIAKTAFREPGLMTSDDVRTLPYAVPSNGSEAHRGSSALAESAKDAVGTAGARAAGGAIVRFEAWPHACATANAIHATARRDRASSCTCFLMTRRLRPAWEPKARSLTPWRIVMAA